MPSHMRKCLAACLLLAAQVTAQSIVATNWTASDGPGSNDTELTISRNDAMVPLAPVLPLTRQASDDIPPIGLSGQIYLADPANQLSITSDQVAFISCDDSDYPGNIDQVDVFGTAASRNASAVLFFTRQADYCALNGTAAQGGYPWVFSMKQKQDTQSVLAAITSGISLPYVAIGQRDQRDANGTSQSGSGDGSQQQQQQQQNNTSLGPSSTAVAMIILYSITGIITALFLAIIITGAVRAHRHPERYGPRAVLGLPRQSRARGLGRAILDTIPIVKFGEREQPKPADVELGDSANGTGAHEVQEGTAATDNAQDSGERPAADPSQERETQPSPLNAEEGIAAATTSAENAASHSEDHPGCSICTEDFEVGQDQRVLPCDHRFHPECVDPWLLNVSSTCPLCRVDLRPQTSRTSADNAENGNTDGTDELEGLPPPLGNQRSSVRQSLRQSILGIGRPDRMTREERVLALRQYRRQQAVRRRHSEAAGEAEPATDSGARNRLSRLFGVRTRQIAEGDRSRHDDDAGDGAGAESSGDVAQR